MNIFLLSNKNACTPAEFQVGDIGVHESDLCVIREDGNCRVYLIEEEPNTDSSWDDNAYIELDGEISEYRDGFVFFFENTQKRQGNKRLLKELIDISPESELTDFLENALDILRYDDDRWEVSAIKGIYKLFDRAKETEEDITEDDSDGEIDNSVSRLSYAESIESSNPEGAFAIYQELANEGIAEAQYALGKCYRLSIGVIKDPDKELEWFLMAAKQGHIDSQYRVAKLYEKSFNPDYKSAFYWYKKASEQGDKRSIQVLISCYTFGRGTEKDEEKASYWQCKLDGVDPNTKPTTYKKEPEKPVVKEDKVQELQEENVTPLSQYEKALQLLSEGTEESQKQATVVLYRAAATQGDAKVLFKLGDCLLKGIGTKKDEQKAIYWIKKSANKGLVEAQYSLAELYFHKKSYQQAHRYYFLAAESGYLDAIYKLGYFFEVGLYVEVNLLKARELYIKAAELNHALACFRLGLLYKDKKPELSKRYLEKANSLGCVEAESELKILIKSGETTESKPNDDRADYVNPNCYPFFELLKEEIGVKDYIMTDSIMEFFADLYVRFPNDFRKARLKFKSEYPNQSIYYYNRKTSTDAGVSARGKLSKKDIRKNQLIEFLERKGYEFIDNTDKQGAFWILVGYRTDFSEIEDKGVSVIYRPHGGKATSGKPAWIASF